MTDIDLLNYAKKAMQQAYSPYSNFKVGAALLTTSGSIFCGCNIENASYGGTICAERVAACNAVSSGDTEFSAIAIVGSNGNPTYPCGICRQFLSEFSRDMTVILLDGDMVIAQSLENLIPHSFKL